MPTSSSELYLYANTALAAYANGALRSDAILYKNSLFGQDMGRAQASDFLSQFRVIDYFSDGIGADSIGVTGLGQGTRVPSFASATVFERVSNGERILAIRGTNNVADWPTDLVSILTFGSPKFQLQYTALKEKVIYWISNGVLTPGFAVTGHSLGGFLAAALTADAGPEISHTYLFNAPGFAGFQVPGSVSTINAWLNKLRPDMPSLDGSKITNVTAQGGSSFVSALGIPVGDRVDIAIETERLPSLNPLELWNSHKIEILTDALAVYDLLAMVDPSISIIDSTKIIEAASPNNRESLERVVSTLALVFGTTALAAVENRDPLFEKIFQLKNTLTASPATGGYHIVPLSDKTAGQIAGLAQSDIAVRYALQKLDPFAVSGKNELFASFNERGQLDLVNNDGSSGTLTREWLADRAELLVAQGFVNTFEDGNTIHRQFGSSQDFVVIQPGLDPRVIRVVGPGGAAPPINTPQIIFGTDQADTLRGLDAADHLYGGFGDDRISGGRGGDYLEGGPGNDTLTGDLGNDHLVGGAGDDTLEGGAGADLLEGGAGFDTYLLHGNDGGDAIVDSDGRGRIELDGVVLTGGRIERPSPHVSGDGHVHYTFAGDLGSPGTLVIDGKTEVHNFRNGDLGILLVAGDAPSPPHAGGSLIFVDHIYDQVSLADLINPPRYQSGSPGDDTYIAGPMYGANFLGFGGNDHLIGGGTQRAHFLGGAGDDWIENHEIIYTPENVSSSPHLLAGESGRDFISGSVNDELLFGDFYQLIVNAAWTNGFHAFIDSMHLTYIPAGVTANSDEQVSSNYSPLTNFFTAVDSGLRGTSAVLSILESFIGYTADTLPDDAYDDVIDGGGGDDIVVGGPGSDALFGGPGDDRLYGDDAFYARPRIPFHTLQIDAPAFEPYLVLFGQPGDDYIEGGDGDDEISDTAGTGSIVSGGDGDDSITVSMASDEAPDLATYALVDGGDGDDTIYAGARDVDIDAGPGNDNIEAVGVEGTLIIDAGPGDDRITGYGVFVFVNGGTGADTYFVNGMDVTIRDDDPDTGNIDTLMLPGPPQDFQFSRDGDDLLIGYWINLSEEDNQLLESAMSIEDWFAGARHQIEQIVFAPDSGEETVWAPGAIAAALDDGGFARSDFIEPDVPDFQPVALSALPPATVPPPAPTDPPRASPDPAPTYPPPALPDPAPAAENDEPVIAPAPNPNVTRLPHVSQVPVHIEITDPGFNGSLRGTASADVFTVLSERGVVIDAGDGDDRITTGGGSDEVRPGPGNDVVSTGGGDDRVIIDRFEGDKRIDAGPGIDILSIDRSISSISGHMEDGRIVIRDAKDGSLAVTNVNIFELADTVFVLANGESEAIVARLYTMALGRTPDAPGVRYWLDEIAAGRPLADVVHIFSSALYTGTQDEQFLEGFYARAFHRAPDPAEESFWLGQLQTGAMTRDQVISGLAASEEAQLAITGVILIPDSL